MRAYQENIADERRQEEGRLREVKAQADDNLLQAQADQGVVRDYVGYVKDRYVVG